MITVSFHAVFVCADWNRSFKKSTHFILPIKFKNMAPWFEIFVKNIRFESIAIILNRVFSNDDRNEAIIDRWAMWINQLSSQWNQIQPWHRNWMWNPTSQPFIDLLEINGYLRFRLSFSLQCFGNFCWSSWPKQIWRSQANGKRYFLFINIYLFEWNVRELRIFFQNQVF